MSDTNLLAGFGGLTVVGRQFKHTREHLTVADAVLISVEKEIIDGHGRVEAAKQLGLRRFPTVRLSRPGARIESYFELGQHRRHRSNLWEYAGGSSFHAGRAEELAMHPTGKPVGLLAIAIRGVSPAMARKSKIQNNGSLLKRGNAHDGCYRRTSNACAQTSF